MDNIARIDRDRYFLLKKGLKKIDPTKNDWEVLFDMELECVVYSDDYDINNLEPLCKNNDDFKCVCGQAHLKPCIVCGSRTIKKDYDYKDNRRKYRCLSCIEKYYVKCMDCKDYFPHKKTDPFHKPRCAPCYHQHRQHSNELVFLSDSDSGSD